MRSRVKSVAILVPVALVLWALSNHWFVPQGAGDWIRVGAFVLFILTGVSRQNKLLLDAGKAVDRPSRLRKLTLFLTTALVAILLVVLPNMELGTTKTVVGWLLVAAVIFLGGAWATGRLRIAASLSDEEIAELDRSRTPKANG